MLMKGGPSVVLGVTAYSRPHRIKLDVCGGDSHLRLTRDGNALVPLLEELAAGTATTVSVLGVCLRKGADEARKLLMITGRDDQMHVVAHLHVRVNGNAMLATAPEQPLQKEAVLSRIRKQAAAIVAPEDQMVGMVGYNDESSRYTRHAPVVGRSPDELCFRGMTSNMLLIEDFLTGSMSPC